MVASNNQPYYDVYVSESNMRFWKVVMEAVSYPDACLDGEHNTHSYVPLVH